jgi:hypothetical protein
MQPKNNKKQIENPILNKIEKNKIDFSYGLTEEDEPEQIILGTNPMLWNAPTYSAVGIDLKKENIENPNFYWENWAKEQEKKKNGTID